MVLVRVFVEVYLQGHRANVCDCTRYQWTLNIENAFNRNRMSGALLYLRQKINAITIPSGCETKLPGKRTGNRFDARRTAFEILFLVDRICRHTTTKIKRHGGATATERGFPATHAAPALTRLQGNGRITPPDAISTQHPHPRAPDWP